MAAQFEDLQSCYLQLRRCGRPAPADGATPSASAATTGAAAACASGAAEPAAGKPSDGAAAAAAGVSSMAAALGEGAAGTGAAVVTAAAGGAGPVGAVLASGGLAEFSRMLSVFTHCSKLRARPLPGVLSWSSLGWILTRISGTGGDRARHALVRFCGRP